MNIRLLVLRLKRRFLNDFSLIFSKNAFVFGMPFHSNAGDQAQSYCIQKWLEKNYPNHKIRWYDAADMFQTNYKIIRRIKLFLKKKDLVFLHSGYHTTDLYLLEEQLQRKVIQSFPNHRIIILPQTVNYITEKEKNKSIRIYNQHNDILFFCRDSISFKMAKELFYNCKLYLFPDIVTSMIGQRTYHHKREGILLCLRNDQEALISNNIKDDLINQLTGIDRVTIVDTTLNIAPNYFIQNREIVLENLWDEYSKYRVVITDRYHGTIFSLISSTPVLVIPSTDHKLISGVDWFPDSFRNYVKFVSEISSIVDLVKKVYKTSFDYCLPPYFKEKYYDKLKSIIESD